MIDYNNINLHIEFLSENLDMENVNIKYHKNSNAFYINQNDEIIHYLAKERVFSIHVIELDEYNNIKKISIRMKRGEIWI